MTIPVGALYTGWTTTKAHADLDALWEQAGTGVTLVPSGGDDTALIQSALTAAGLTRGTVHLSTGHFDVRSTLTVPSYVSVIGNGSAMSVIDFSPSADDTCLSVSNGVSASILNRIEGIGFYDPNFSHTNVALEVSDVSSCIINDIYIYGVGTGSPSGPYWKGTGLLTKGREATSVSNVRIVTKGGHGINIAANPNTARTDGEDIDHWNFHNIYMVTDKTGSDHNIHVDTGIGLIDLSFSGYQAWVGGASHFVWNDNRVAPTIVSRNVTFENVRTEQCGSTSGWGFDLAWTQPIETITIRNALISATSQGISLNGFLQARLETVIAATGADPLCSLKLAGATGGSTLSIADCYWQPGSKFDVTGYNLIFSPTFAASVTVGPSNAIYANTFTGSKVQMALIFAFCTAAQKGLKVFASSGDGLTVLPQASGSGVVLRSENTSETDFQDMSLVFDGLTLKQRTGSGTASTIVEAATGTTPKLGFFGVSPVARAVLAHGSTADQIADALAALGLTSLT